MTDLYERADTVFPAFAIVLAKIGPVSGFFYSSNVLLASGMAFRLSRPLPKRILVILSIIVISNSVLIMLSATPYLRFCEPIDHLEIIKLSFWDYFSNYFIWLFSIIFAVTSYVKRTT